MGKITRVVRVFSPIMLTLGLLLFLQPFIAVSCGSLTAHYSGLTLALGGDPRVDPIRRASSAILAESRIGPQAPVTFALAVIFLTFVLALVLRSPHRREALVGALALLAAVTLGGGVVWFRSQLLARLESRVPISDPSNAVVLDTGFWTELLILGAVALLNLGLVWMDRRQIMRGRYSKFRVTSSR